MQLCSVGLREGVMRQPANATTCTECQVLAEARHERRPRA